MAASRLNLKLKPMATRLARVRLEQERLAWTDAAATVVGALQRARPDVGPKA